MSHNSSPSNNETTHNNSPSQSHHRVPSSSSHHDEPSGHGGQSSPNHVSTSLAPPPGGHTGHGRNQTVASSTGLSSNTAHHSTSTHGRYEPSPHQSSTTRARFFIAPSEPSSSRGASPQSPAVRIVVPPTPSPPRSWHSSQGEPATFRLDTGSRNSSRPPSSNGSSYYFGSYGSNYQGSTGSYEADRSLSADAIPSRDSRRRLHSPSPSPPGVQPQALLLPPQQHIVGFGDRRNSSDEHAGQPRPTAQFLRGRGRGAPHGSYPSGSSRRN